MVWPHHVGLITDHTKDGEWIVSSGNDDDAVRNAAALARGHHRVPLAELWIFYIVCSSTKASIARMAHSKAATM
jgi:hypothetical protein